MMLSNTQARNEICGRAKMFKGVEGFRKIYVKRDVHPAIRKEHGRLHKLVKDERNKPENQGCNISYDVKSGTVKKDNLVIDTYNPFF